jgi:uncharacterized protein (DUF58 family)
MFLVSLNNNNNLALLLTFLLASMFVISLIYTHSNLLGLQILSIRGKPVFAGERLKLTCTFFSQKLVRPLLSIRIENQSETVTTVDENKNLQVACLAETTTRGIYKPEVLIIETEFPFSFFRSWTYVKTDVECLVYPRPLHSEHRGTCLDANTISEDGGGSRSGSEDFDSLRGYQAGDPIRQVYWKGYSRGGGLHSKTYSGGKAEVSLFDFDDIPENDIESKLSVLCHLVKTANADDQTFALRISGMTIGPDSGDQHTQACLKELALYGRPERSEESL